MFLVYNKETTMIMRPRQYAPELYKTEAAAKAFLTRMVKMGYHRDDYAVAESNHFCANIEKYRRVKNLMTGETAIESVNTPNSCSVASESYWSN